MRQAVAQRAERTSLRAAARELGMSPTGLKKFLDGGAPYTKTLLRLRRWYLQHAANATMEELSGEEAVAALGVLVHDLPPGSARALTVAAIVESMERGYARSGRLVPAWVGPVREHFGIAAQ
jgi:hypothetical protein